MAISAALADAFVTDAVARLTVLDFGLFQVRSTGRIIGIPGYLVETRAGRRILIDTGFPAAYAGDPAGAAARDGLGSFGSVLRLTPDNLPAGQMAKCGLKETDIGLVILTHSHIDHVGGLAGLAHCPILVGAAERAEPHPLYFGDRRPLAWPDADYATIDSDLTLCAGLTILATPGHTAGHLSVLVTLPETGPMILAADAINRASEPDEGYADAADPATARKSGERLMAMARDLGAFFIYGHEPSQWPELRKAPDFYL